MSNPSDHPPSILSRVSIGTNDFQCAKAFYDAVLALGGMGDGAPGNRAH